MEIKDKRLIEITTNHEQSNYVDALARDIQDAKDKYEESTIEHEPIGLLERIYSKKNKEKHAYAEPGQTHNDKS